MERTRESVLKDIQEHPERHMHDWKNLFACCLIGDTVVLEALVAHATYVPLGSNGGVRCDVLSGPCACGAWH
ncbi:MAG: hypothetical protein Q7R62_00870 [bacterium]|nr:hypothetical protein [bacterium]